MSRSTERCENFDLSGFPAFLHRCQLTNAPVGDFMPSRAFPDSFESIHAECIALSCTGDPCKGDSRRLPAAHSREAALGDITYTRAETEPGVWLIAKQGHAIMGGSGRVGKPRSTHAWLNVDAQDTRDVYIHKVR